MRPQAVIPPDESITLRSVERLLRGAGLPRKFVKALLASGWKAATQDAGNSADAGAAEALVQCLNSATERLKKVRHHGC